MLSANGKTKFEHWMLDINFSQAISLAIFFICMVLSVGMPIILPFGAIFFTIKYFIEKYNLIYVYPAEFDTKVVNRKTLIVSIIVALLMF